MHIYIHMYVCVCVCVSVFVSVSVSVSLFVCVVYIHVHVQSGAYTGKCKSNFLGTEFTIWDQGGNPQKLQAAQEVCKNLQYILYFQENTGKK